MAAITEKRKPRVVGSKSGPFSALEARELFDKTARQYLHISGEEFLHNWDLGRLDPSDGRVKRVAILLPLVRKTRARQKHR